MSKLDKEYFIEHFERILEIHKSNLDEHNNEFKKTNDVDLMASIGSEAFLICFYSDLLDVLRE